jgi:hypothetical protein
MRNRQKLTKEFFDDSQKTALKIFISNALCVLLFPTLDALESQTSSHTQTLNPKYFLSFLVRKIAD